MNSVERVIYYAKNLEQEPPHKIPERKPEASWPAEAGFLCFRDNFQESREFSEQTLHSNTHRHVSETLRGLLCGLGRFRR